MDGSEDNKVKVQGLPNYVPPRPNPAVHDSLAVELPGDNAPATVEAQIPEVDPDLQREQKEVEVQNPNDPVDTDFQDVIMIQI